MDKCEATRWELLEETSPSGKTLYKCTQCERKSYTPDKWCGTTCGDQLEHVEFLHGECNHLLREFSDANTEARALRAEVERLRTVLAFYADRDNYPQPEYPGYEGTPIANDEGEKAREALGGE